MEGKNIPLKRPIEDGEVKYLIDNAEFNTMTMYDKCTIVTCKLPNGFVLVESSSCVDPADYDEQIGIECCCRRIIDKVYELVGYNRQVKKYHQEQLMSMGGKEVVGHED